MSMRSDFEATWPTGRLLRFQRSPLKNLGKELLKLLSQPLATYIVDRTFNLSFTFHEELLPICLEI